MTYELLATATGAVTAVAAVAYFVVMVSGLGFFLWRASRLLGHPEGLARTDVATAALAFGWLIFMIVGGFFFFQFFNIGT